MTKSTQRILGFILLGGGIALHFYYASASGASSATTTTTALSNVAIGAGAAFLIAAYL